VVLCGRGLESAEMCARPVLRRLCGSQKMINTHVRGRNGNGLGLREVKVVAMGLKRIKAVNRLVSKSEYFLNATLYSRSKAINRTFRKHVSTIIYSTKLAIIYERVAY
jgi:hypothetical protein